MAPFAAWARCGTAVLLLVTACKAPVATPYPTYTPLPTYTPYPPPVVTLHIVDDFFQESDIVVVKGTVVTWRNDGESPHSATGVGGSSEHWDTGLVLPGQQVAHAFTAAGLFGYFCKVHEYMNGTVRVIG